VTTPNLLAERYASDEMKSIWSPENLVRTERDFWLAVLKAQKAAGLSVSESSISAYENQIDQIDLESIRHRELVTKHDVKARIEEFNALAGQQLIHLGLTSRDVTENVEQILIRESCQLVAKKSVALLARWAEFGMRYSKFPVVARTHNVPAQVTTLGKRFATWGEELLYAYLRMQDVMASYPLRGVTGAVGTGNDLEAVLGSKSNKYQTFQGEIRDHLHTDKFMSSTGQIYPRSLDFFVVSTLSLVAAAPSSFATTIRLLAGDGLVSEGFGQGQVGSSAMPHKMNARSCERINGLNVVLKGFLSMFTSLTGSQWYEGDVSCSVVRRIALPNSFYAIDGLLDTTIRVSDDLSIYEEAFSAELASELPLLASGQIMAAAVKAGVGREDAHWIIGEQARNLLAARREGEPFSLAHALAKEARLGLSESAISEIIETTGDTLGQSVDQVAEVVEAVAALIALNPSWAKYQPGKSV